jgi:hypothetical protein
VNGLPDPVRFFGGIGGLIEAAAKAAKSEQPQVFVFGEAVALLQAEGRVDAAIRFEQLGNHLAKSHQVDILCTYPFRSPRGCDLQHKLVRHYTLEILGKGGVAIGSRSLYTYCLATYSGSL